MHARATPPTLVARTESAAAGWRRFVAAFLSAIVPGSGEWLVRARASAFFYLAGAVAIFILYRWIRAPQTYRSFVLMIAAAIALCSLSAWDALRVKSPITPPKSALWLALFIPIAMMSAAAHSNWMLQSSGFQLYTIPSSSMEKTLLIGDRLVADMWYFRDHVVRAGDIVIFHKDGQQLCKRVIATAGSVEGINGRIYVNASLIEEPYVVHELGSHPPDLDNFGPIDIPAGKLFVMGDNRDVSLDSRSPAFGLVNETDLIGKPLFVYYSEREHIGSALR